MKGRLVKRQTITRIGRCFTEEGAVGSKMKNTKGTREKDGSLKGKKFGIPSEVRQLKVEKEGQNLTDNG